jgi:dATP pyrophosphohydrolase
MSGPAFKRPESVLVVVHTRSQVLLLERVEPTGFWQSVTGSLRPDESPRDAAARELVEETGFRRGADLRDLRLTQRFPIAPAWRDRYAPDVVENVEHAFALCLRGAIAPQLNPAEHRDYRWLDADAAETMASSHTNVTAIRRVFRRDT